MKKSGVFLALVLILMALLAMSSIAHGKCRGRRSHLRKPHVHKEISQEVNCESEFERFLPERELCVPRDCNNCNNEFGPYEIDLYEEKICRHTEFSFTFSCI